MSENLPATYAVLRVYDRDGVTFRDEIDAAGVSWVDELSGEGSAQYTIPFIQRAVQANPDLLRDAIVKVAVPLTYGAAPTEIFGWVSTPGSGTLIGDQLDASRQETPASRGLMSLMDDWVLMAENGFRRTQAVARFIGWMSKEGPWYDAGDWFPPVFVRTQASFSTPSGGVSTARYGLPEGWLFPESYWIWSQNGTEKLTLFRTTFTTSETRLVQIYITADETFIAYVNSEEVASGSATEIGYKDIHTVQDALVLNAGTHTLAIAMTTIGTADIGDGADMLMAAVAALGSDGLPAETLRVSDGTNWQTYTTTIDGLRPGWTAADIVIALKGEASARGITSMDTITLGFTGDNDTNSVPWPDIQERSWGNGTTGNTILSDLSETDVHWDMTPALVLNAYIDQGTNRTSSQSCPTLEPGVNLLNYTWQGIPLLGTRVMIRSPEAWSIITNSVAEMTYAPRELFLESGSSASTAQANRVGQRMLDEFSTEHRSYTAAMVGKSGCMPYVDFFKGDIIWGLNQQAQRVAVRVLSIGGARPDDGGIVTWLLELGEVS